MSIVQSVTGSNTPASVIASASDWRTAVTDLIAFLVANGRCFSSGEVAAYLRTYRPDLAFRVSGVGDYIRDAYDNGTIPNYDDGQGNSVYATQVPRTATGIARTLDGRTVTTKTPVGQPVFVYARDGGEGFAHDFEIYVPDFDDPTAQRATLYTGPAPVQPTVQAIPQTSVPSGFSATVSAPPSASVGILITGTLSKDDLTAYVRPDRRLCVPRAAFEAFVNLTGIPLRGGPQGDPVYVGLDGSKMVITRDTPAGASAVQAYHLWATRGRIAVDMTGTKVSPGDKYKITVSANDLMVDLSVKVN